MPLTSPLLAISPRLQKASKNQPPLGAGESNEGVRVLQVALIRIGYSIPISTGNGKTLPDGAFGKETLKVVRAFQSDQKLTVDGIVGHDTLACLDARIVTLDRDLMQAALDELNLRASLLLPGSAGLFSATTARGTAPPGAPSGPARPTGQSTAAGVNLRGVIRGSH
jgi:hypothetical protein